MMTLCGILPFLGTLLWMVSFFTLAPADRRSWRLSLALACVLMAAFAFVVTEIFSLTGLLTWSPIFAAWGLFCMVPAFVMWQGISDLRGEPRRVWDFLKACPGWVGILLVGTAGLIFLMGIATPPMNFDVQIYHLPRQVFWLMQGSVEPFAAAHSHQISMPVLSEFIGLNLLILSSGDHWHNLVQSLFLLASCGLVGLMSESLGGSRRAGWLGILFAVLVPVIFFEASNAKNDIIVAFFVLLPVALALRVWRGDVTASNRSLLLAALSAGLAIATKGTAIAYLPAAGLALALAYIRRHSWRPILLAAIPGLALAIMPAAPQLYRNLQAFGSPAGPNLHHTNQSHGPKDLANVAIRNIAGQFTCNSGAWNESLENSARTLLSKLGCDPDDPATTFESQSFHLPYFAGLEDLVPAPAQTALILLLPLGFLFPAFRRHSGTALLFGILLLSLILFCAIFRWQPWQGRLLIPAYLLAAPLAGIFLDSLRPRFLPILFAAWALASLRPHMIYAGQRPLFGEGSILRNKKTDQMSRMHPGRSSEINKLVAYLRDSKIRQALIDGGATEIYGLLRELHQRLPELHLLSGSRQNAGPAEAIITPVLPDAGVPVPPANPAPTAPEGFKPAWIGDYYILYKKEAAPLAPLIAASFAGYAPTTELTEIWKQGASLKKSGRNSTSQSFDLKPLSHGELQISLEGKGPNGAMIAIKAGDIHLEQPIENGRFTLQKQIHLPPNSPLQITTSEKDIFWTSIRILPAEPHL